MNLFICINDNCEDSEKYASEESKIKCLSCGKEMKRIGRVSSVGFKGTQEKGKTAKYRKQ